MQTLNDFFVVLRDIYGDGLLCQPMHWDDEDKDKACRLYISDFGVDHIQDEILDQFNSENILSILVGDLKFVCAIYSIVEQKLIELVDQYNDELDNDDPIDPIDAAGHTDRDFF